ncbi:unnamed protein product [Dimorphilus gyrociliatus]|uniref:C2H2-type domain-containing protein n=1 Tax=Dimorphilus gyrociliatus TaxID=2664684 RepID=A0A7I8VE10_9ANNE|nr:unnamed protein product [Dimorphilus gyrociliatus]
MNERTRFIDIIRGLISHTATCTLFHEKYLKIKVNLDVEVDEKTSWKASFLTTSDETALKPNNPLSSPKATLKKYPCLLCPATFKYSSNLRRHENQQHNRTTKRRGSTKLSKIKLKDNGNNFQTEKEVEFQRPALNNELHRQHPQNISSPKLNSTRDIIDVKRIIDALQSKKSCSREDTTEESCVTVFSIEEDHINNNNLSSEENASEANSFSCPLCPTSCNRMSNLYRHIRTKHPDKPSILPQEKKLNNLYKCPFCFISFSFSTNMRRHVRKKHPEKRLENKSGKLT